MTTWEVEYGYYRYNSGAADHLIPWSGCLKAARVFRVEREEVPVPSSAAESRP